MKSGNKKKKGLRKRLEEVHFFRRGIALAVDVVLIVFAAAFIFRVLEKTKVVSTSHRMTTVEFYETSIKLLQDQLEEFKKAKDVVNNVGILSEDDMRRVDEQGIYEAYKGAVNAIKEKARPENLGLKNIIQEIVVTYLYFTLCFFFGGRTLGKKLTGLKVIGREGTKITLWESFERAHGYAASMALLGMGFVQILWDKHALTLHDKIAGSTVVRIRKKHKEGTDAAKEEPAAPAGEPVAKSGDMA